MIGVLVAEAAMPTWVWKVLVISPKGPWVLEQVTKAG